MDIKQAFTKILQHLEAYRGTLRAVVGSGLTLKNVAESGTSEGPTVGKEAGSSAKPCTRPSVALEMQFVTSDAISAEGAVRSACGRKRPAVLGSVRLVC